MRQKAYLQLLAAIPIAAQAAYHDITWEALSATLSEANRVPETELIPSLQAPVPGGRHLGVQPDPRPRRTPAAG